MKKFKQKIFTIQEGHYTGPKDMDKVPGFLEMMGKSALIGSGIGAIGGKVMKDSTMLEGAITGGKYGTIAGALLKIFLNHLHNPMKTIKYQEVDKLIRREFGIYRVSGITVGDSISKRASIDERFGFNDRNITSYKINIAIQDNEVTMYTFGMTDSELDKTSKILDYYCKTYFGMEYSSYLINSKVNSYSVNITFTNYQIISNFLMELSKELNTKINLINNKALVDIRLSSQQSNEEEKTFSVSFLNKYDIYKILSQSGYSTVLSRLEKKLSGGRSISEFILSTILYTIDKLNSDIAAEVGVKVPASNLNNKYLESVLKKNHYFEGFNYTVGEKNSPINMSIVSGLFILTINKDCEEFKSIDKIWSSLKLKMNKSNSDKVAVYSYIIKSRSEFEFILKKFMSAKIIPNIFE